MNTREIAQALGQRGGRARARRLSASERTRIAALGAAARLRSLEAARRVMTNLRYAAMIIEMQGRPDVNRMTTCNAPLPGIYV